MCSNVDVQKPFYLFLVLFFNCMLTFGSYYCFDMPSVLQDEMLKDYKCNDTANSSCCHDCLGMTPSQYNLLYDVYSWTNVFVVIGAGFFIDKYGNQVGAFLFSSLCVIGSSIFALGAFYRATQYLLPLMLLGRLIFGAGNGSLTSSNSIKYLLNNLLNLQSEILHKNVELSNVNQDTGKQSDEEIPSDTEDEIEDQTENSEGSVKKPLKRKLKCEEYGEIVAKPYKSLLPYRNSVIGKWDEKTKLSSRRITQKSFKVFDSSAIKQIEEESISKRDMLLKDYDTEIFDDDDFYRQQLRDVVDSKKQMEIQEIRNKIKKKVDTKASKERKIRYDVHPKLRGYFKHLPPPTIPDDVR